MKELTQKEFHESASDPADPSLVERYLSIKDDTSLFKQAAMIAVGNLGDDPAKVFEKTTRLGLEAVNSASRLRLEHLLAMNAKTLEQLSTRILDQDILFVYLECPGHQSALKDYMNDPVTGPLLEMMWKREILPRHKDQRIAEELGKLSEMPVPELPCDLEAAIRWASGEPKIHFNILNQAFVDWTVTIIKISGERRRTIETYGESFKPGKRHSKRRLDAAKSTIDLALGEQKKISAHSHLKTFGTEFREFWKRHKSIYVQRAKKKSYAKSTSGRGGPISRMRPVFIGHTREFVNFLEGQHNIQDCRNELHLLVDNFAKSRAVDRRTQNKIGGFLKTLRNYVASPLSDELVDTIVNLLKSEQIKAIDKTTVRSCIEIMRERADF